MNDGTVGDGGESSSDDEHETVEPTQPQWKLFEATIAELIEDLDENAEVERDVTMLGRLSGTRRQVDVLIRGSIGGEVIVIAVECKCYSRRLGIGSVDEFAGKLLDIGVDRGILFGLSGVTGPAKRRADGAVQPRITIGDLVTREDHLEPDLDWLLGSDCPNVNCMTGRVEWSSWETEAGDSLRAGACDTCGSWAVQCPECGDFIDFFTDDSECFSCGQVSASLLNDSHNVGPVEIVIRRGSRQESFEPVHQPDDSWAL